MKFWSFKNEAGADDVELRIDGDIVDDDEAWLYEWFGLKAVCPNAFRDELSQYAGKNLSVWIDSYGGSVFAATGIYNALMEHKKTGAKVTTMVDAKAMSAATIPFMAGDVRKISPGGIFMVHNPLTYASGYASDLRKVADVLDVVKESIINAYQLGTGLSRNKISSLMDDETYMSAKTAISQGFATEMLYAPQKSQDEPLENVMNFSFKRLAIQNAADDSMRKFCDLAKKLSGVQCPPAKPAANTKNKGVNEVPVINTLDELKKEYPELVNQLISQAGADAVTVERARVAALDALDDPQNAAVHEIVSDAKASGKTAEEVKAVVDIVKKHAPEPAPAANAAQNFMVKALADNKNSGVDGLKASGAGGVGGDDRQEKAAAASYMAEIINKKNGRVSK